MYDIFDHVDEMWPKTSWSSQQNHNRRNFRKSSLKKNQASTGFEPVLPNCLLVASTNWVTKQQGGFFRKLSSLKLFQQPESLDYAMETQKKFLSAFREYFLQMRTNLKRQTAPHMLILTQLSINGDRPKVSITSSTEIQMKLRKI